MRTLIHKIHKIGLQISNRFLEFFTLPDNVCHFIAGISNDLFPIIFVGPKMLCWWICQVRFLPSFLNRPSVAEKQDVEEKAGNPMETLVGWVSFV